MCHQWLTLVQGGRTFPVTTLSELPRGDPGQGVSLPGLTRFLIVDSWGFSNFLFLRRSSGFLLSRGSIGGLFGWSSDFFRGASSHSTFRFTASGTTSLFSRLIFCSLSNEPGRLEAYLNPGPRFCLYAREEQKHTSNLYTLCLFAAPYSQ